MRRPLPSGRLVAHFVGARPSRVLGAADPAPVDVRHVRVAVDDEGAGVFDLDQEGGDARLHVSLARVAEVEDVPA